MQTNLGETICKYRQIQNMTQEEFASRLGVTPQAVSKWERNTGLPDVSFLSGICSILGISADTLLGLPANLVENGDITAEKEIRNNLIAEPLLLEFGKELIPCFIEGLETDYVNQKRKELAIQTGMLMPVIRIQDNADLEKMHTAFSLTAKCFFPILCPKSMRTHIQRLSKKYPASAWIPMQPS